MKSLIVMSLITATFAATAEETLPALKDGTGPQNFEELWAGFDPQAEPLDVEVLQEWEEDGVLLKVLRYRIGVFKGQRAMMAAVYGAPKDGSDLPGLVQIHGGGQYAHSNACLTNAKRGYATLSVAWAGRLSGGGYHVSPGVVKLYWEGKTDDPSYRVTTDWGALDGYHAPFRYQHAFSVAKPHEHSFDAVASPRNDSWFLCALGARRALTFLERQPEVNGEKLGVYGHSMGGKLTVMTAGADARVKAAAPSCGGISHRNDKDPLISTTTCDDVYLKRLSCPIMFLSPANDFHGRIDDLETAVREIKTEEWRITSAAHHNHQDTADYEVATQLWMDEHLKGTFSWPETPQVELTLVGKEMPEALVTPDASRRILSVDVYYSQQFDQPAGDRFWHYVAPVQNGGSWLAKLPLHSVDKEVAVFANIRYALDEPVTGAGYYYGIYTTEAANLSSLLQVISVKELKAAKIGATMKQSQLIESFEGDWEKEWFTYKQDPALWGRTTRKACDDAYRAPAFAKLALEVQAEQANTLRVGLGQMNAEVALEGGGKWQEVVLFPVDFADADGAVRLDWEGVWELSLDKSGKWQGAAPAFRNLRWQEGMREELNARREVKLLQAPVVAGKVFLDVEYADAATHGYKIAMNSWLDGKPLVRDGKTYANGLSTHAASELVFFLGGKFEGFDAIALAGPGATVAFSVRVDGATVFESGALKPDQSKPIALSLRGRQELKLVVTDGGNGKGGDHACWLDAQLTLSAEK